MMFTSCVLMGACGCLLSIGDSFVLFVLAALCCGSGFGISMVAGSLFTTYNFGEENYSVIFGAMLPVSTLMAALGPAITGAVVAATGSYSGPFLVMGLTNLGTAVLCLFSTVPAKRRGTA